MSEVKATQRRRSYRSPARQEGARRTRQAIVRAAAELFAQGGFSATSLADVAAAAGVARPTVFAAFGSKAALMRQVIDEALAGDDEPVAVADRIWFRPVWDAATPAAVLDAYADVCLLIGQRAARLFEAARRAADTTPGVVELWNTLQQNRRAGATMVVEHIRSVGELNPDVTTEAAVDIIWIFNDPAHYAALVLERRWTESAFRTWLASSMRASLIGADGTAPGHGPPTTGSGTVPAHDVADRPKRPGVTRKQPAT
jgi:AcrR family transcriptional regulator